VQYGNKRGEAFGLSHNFMQIGYCGRTIARTLQNLFFVGQSTHPGCGSRWCSSRRSVSPDRILEEVVGA
jgi:phytoene dehydrogenase-like protein